MSRSCCNMDASSASIPTSTSAASAISTTSYAGVNCTAFSSTSMATIASANTIAASADAAHTTAEATAAAAASESTIHALTRSAVADRSIGEFQCQCHSQTSSEIQTNGFEYDEQCSSYTTITRERVGYL